MIPQKLTTSVSGEARQRPVGRVPGVFEEAHREPGRNGVVSARPPRPRGGPGPSQ